MLTGPHANYLASLGAVDHRCSESKIDSHLYDYCYQHVLGQESPLFVVLRHTAVDPLHVTFLVKKKAHQVFQVLCHVLRDEYSEYSSVT